MTAVILQSNYLPWKGYFDLIQSADVFIYYDEVQYTKNDWRNRNIVYSKSGLHWLTIPICREAVKMKISEVPLPSSLWQKQHHKTLCHSYLPAPFFSQIRHFLDDVYLNRSWVLLSELNRHIIETVAGMLGIQTRFLNSKDFNLDGQKVERLVRLLQQIGADTYLTGPSAKDYLAGHEDLFDRAGILLQYKSYEGYPRYPQLRPEFEHGVSILDLLANVQIADCRGFITATPQINK